MLPATSAVRATRRPSEEFVQLRQGERGGFDAKAHADAIDRQEAQGRGIEDCKDADGGEQDRRLGDEAQQRRAVIVGRPVDPWLAHRSEGDHGRYQHGGADQERSPALDADEADQQRAAGEARREHAGIDGDDLAALAVPGKFHDPGFAQHQKRRDAHALEEAQHEPPFDRPQDLVGENDQGGGEGGPENDRLDAEAAHQRRDHQRGGEDADRRHRGIEPDQVVGITALGKNER